MNKPARSGTARKPENEFSYVATAWILDGIWHIASMPFRVLSHFFFEGKRSFSIPKKARERHTYVTGQSGSGKTEVLKNLIYEDIADGQSSVIVIDPHGDLAEDVARFDLNRSGSRLVFLDPRLSPGLAPCFNPFDVPDEYRTPEIVDAMADNLAETFIEMLKTTGLTVQMRSLLKPVLSTLLLRPGSGITDVVDFFDEERNGALMGFALGHLSNPEQIRFLRREFHGENYNTSKAGIAARIQALTNSLTFSDTMIGPATVRFHELMDARNVVVVRLSGGTIGHDTAETLARFILASVKNAALFRQPIPYGKRVPCHVFVDECQLFVTESIEQVLNETRKYRVHLTLAQQIAGWGMETSTKRAVLANTGVKITGKNSADTLSTMAKETGADLDVLQALTVGKFHVKASDDPGVVVRIPSRLAHGGASMPPDEWERVKADQLARFYRPAPRHVPGTDPHSGTPDESAEGLDDFVRKRKPPGKPKPPRRGPSRPIPPDNE